MDVSNKTFPEGFHHTTLLITGALMTMTTVPYLQDVVCLGVDLYLYAVMVILGLVFVSAVLSTLFPLGIEHALRLSVRKSGIERIESLHDVVHYIESYATGYDAHYYRWMEAIATSCNYAAAAVLYFLYGYSPTMLLGLLLYPAVILISTFIHGMIRANHMDIKARALGLIQHFEGKVIESSNGN